MCKSLSCHDTHNMTTLSWFSFSFSIVLCVCTVSLNALLIVAVFGKRKKVFKKSIFYKLLFNITFADLLTGIITDVGSISFHFKEAKKIVISRNEVYLVHVGLFMFSNVSIFSMALICVDRIIALIKPIEYRKGLSDRICILLLVSTWFISFLLVLPYFYIKYVCYLTVFSFTLVFVTFIALVLMVYLYKTRFTLLCNLDKMSSTSVESYKSNQINDAISKERRFQIDIWNKKKNYDLQNVSQLNENVRPKQPINQQSFRCSENKTKIKSYSAEKRVNQSFIIMLIVFLATYFPSCCVTLYINTCEQCNCSLIHILRDFTYLSLLSSALWRSINFAVRIITLKKRIKEIINQIKCVLLCSSAF
ncbi:uncharacterized protein LOC105849937 [Hydra vulgaris]|uniref:uncharacterized protein LOC105849937 n=1 Tax=Hydra vulgaris TaxID=6087 RepID=UPI00064163C1|nr:uncharacterized protein LOC105849937 [Hydra vulgaris]